jgi:2-amino-4-hydroxy-6-hydroxymethyldihydropteridine diphosphokinase
VPSSTLSITPLNPAAQALLDAAAEGNLPDWAVADDARREHIFRVFTLLRSWAESMGLDPAERNRWGMAGVLHDVLRNAEPDILRPLIPEALRHLPDAILHGPAAATRLKTLGVRDPSLLLAVSHHSLGHPGMDLMGRALYAADVLEPGRTFRPSWRAELRARFPEAPVEVVREVLAARLGRAIEKEHHLLPDTVAFWNGMLEEGAA